MGARKLSVDIAIFLCIVIGVFLWINNHSSTVAIIFLIAAIGISVFRRAIYDIF